MVDCFNHIYTNLLEFYKKFLFSMRLSARKTIARYYINLMKIRKSLQNTHKRNTFYYLDAVINEQYTSEKIKLDTEPEPDPQASTQSFGKPIRRVDAVKIALRKAGITIFALLITFMYVFICGYTRDMFAM